MADSDYVEDFPQRAVLSLTGVLSLSPQYGVTSPSEAWLDKQKKLVEQLPKCCLRPPSDVMSPIKLLTRGLMKVSEKHALPFVPSAAVLCSAHKALNPWRIRSLFLLVACEVGIRSDRIRRFRGFEDGIPLSQEVQDFVYRMTSVASLWIAPGDFKRRFGYPPPQELPRLASGCEACMLAIVGARAQLLVDLRANMLSRRRQHRSHREPALLRFVDAWTEWFGNSAELLVAESERLGNELRGIRKEIGRRRHLKRKQARKEGNPVPYSKSRKPEKNAQGYPMPSPSRRSRPSRPASHGAEPSAEREGEYRSSSPVHDTPYAMSGGLGPVPTPTSAATTDKYHFEEDEDGRDEQDPHWADDIGSYYWDNNNPGARANWGQAAADAVHPAFRVGAANANTQGGGGGGPRRGSTPALSSTDMPRPIPSPVPHRASRSSIVREKQADHDQDNDDDAWTEPTLHTAGGRTNLDLAPPIPVTPSLVNLTRDATDDWNAASPSSVYSTDGPARPHPPPADTSSSSQQKQQRQGGKRNSASASASAVPSSRVTSFGMFMRHHDGTKPVEDDARTIRPEDSISTVGTQNNHHHDDGGSRRRGGKLGGLYREDGVMK
ncbi:hypothetical protein SODALDRAFT_57203 [Sodiomyces alkalinus F11]|uniref:Uncharacterized protein n=1 Tax=Sodiomyces alkalinus (strain CBS 110278 / VKM F-3762 / F11) TaxID=1314773 RepID=A0A3N2PNX6_SODAK|nr:hypothetical protein SODALDRAFT_57203 [Sodiomyces alkalinus F11]ROT36056.1 hypothetical protein SODALDRAFT_57203 [Sodiomyces alkalinus F11]